MLVRDAERAVRWLLGRKEISDRALAAFSELTNDYRERSRPMEFSKLLLHMLRRGPTFTYERAALINCVRDSDEFSEAAVAMLADGKPMDDREASERDQGRLLGAKAVLLRLLALEKFGHARASALRRLMADWGKDADLITCAVQVAECDKDVSCRATALELLEQASAPKEELLRLAAALLETPGNYYHFIGPLGVLSRADQDGERTFLAVRALMKRRPLDWGIVGLLEPLLKIGALGTLLLSKDLDRRWPLIDVKTQISNARVADASEKAHVPVEVVMREYERLAKVFKRAFDLELNCEWSAMKSD